MQIFTPAFEQEHFNVDATPSFCLPTAKCPLCQRDGGGAGAGYNLPWAKLELLPINKNQLSVMEFWKKPRKGSLCLEEIDRVRTALRKMSPCPTPVPFGVSFGPIIGTVTSPLEGVTATHYEGISATTEQIDEIATAGIYMESFPANLTFKRGIPFQEIREIWAPPLARFANQERIEWCSFCESGKYRDREFQGLERENLQIERSSIPKGRHLFRVWESPASLCASEHFVEVISTLGVNKTNWEPVTVVG